MSMLHDGTEWAEHIQIIITAAQEVNNVIPNLVPGDKYHNGPE